MKRFFSLLLIAVLVLGCFTGCGKKDDNVSDDPDGMIEDTTKPTASPRPSTQEPSTQTTELLPSESKENSNSIGGSDQGMGGAANGTPGNSAGNGMDGAGNGMSGSDNEGGSTGSEGGSSSATEGIGRNRRARPLFR